MKISPKIKEAYYFYQQFLTSIEKNDIVMFVRVINTKKNDILGFFRKSIKTLTDLDEYVLNILKYQYTNATVEGKNNKIKVIKRISFGYANFRNYRLRILLI